jgi:hypothetical protein
MAWKELFGTDVGLLSLAVIVIIIGMAIYFVRMFVNKANTEVPVAPSGSAGTRPPASPKA